MSTPTDFLENDIGVQTMDIAASSRKFQQSVIVKQDPNKSGIISFLQVVEEETQSQPERRGSATILVNNEAGTYGWYRL